MTNDTKRLVIFAHYDKDNLVDEYVYYYLNELKKIATHICMVSTSNLDTTHRHRIDELGFQLICRENIGYDFMSYKIGLHESDLSKYDEVIICNDSVYGPFFPLEKLFKHKNIQASDFWGITDSYQTEHHLQSYFLVFKRSAFLSPVFQEFWNSVVSLAKKDEIIRQYEIGMTRKLADSGLIFSSTYQAKTKSLKNTINSLWKYRKHYINTLIKRMFKKDFYDNLPEKLRNLGITNPTHENWSDTVKNNTSPFIKIELLRDNPVGVKSTENIIPTIQEMYDYPTWMIKAHLGRNSVKLR